jgi:hypothetical protein
MKPTDRQKMCPNCDGRIPFEATQCPYCFSEQQVDHDTKSFTASSSDFSSDPLAALYPIPASSGQKTSRMAEHSEESADAQSVPFWPILMLSLGSNLLTVGILQFFFSDHGVLRLEMNASYWFLMVLVAIPLIYFGLKNFSSKSSDSN